MRRRTGLAVRFAAATNGQTGAMAASASQQVAILKILIAASETALDAFRAADNRVDDELVTDLERVLQRSRQELASLAAKA